MPSLIAQLLSLTHPRQKERKDSYRWFSHLHICIVSWDTHAHMHTHTQTHADMHTHTHRRERQRYRERQSQRKRRINECWKYPWLLQCLVTLWFLPIVLGVINFLTTWIWFVEHVREICLVSFFTCIIFQFYLLKLLSSVPYMSHCIFAVNHHLTLDVLLYMFCFHWLMSKGVSDTGLAQQR